MRPIATRRWVMKLATVAVGAAALTLGLRAVPLLWDEPVTSRGERPRAVRQPLTKKAGGEDATVGEAIAAPRAVLKDQSPERGASTPSGAMLSRDTCDEVEAAIR